MNVYTTQLAATGQHMIHTERLCHQPFQLLLCNETLAVSLTSTFLYLQTIVNITTNTKSACTERQKSQAVTQAVHKAIHATAIEEKNSSIADSFNTHTSTHL